MASPTPPAGAYSSPCLPCEWLWQYSPEADEVYYIHKPTDARQWEHPDGQAAETSFYQWLGSQLGSAGFAASPPVTPPPDSLAPPGAGAPLARHVSAPSSGGGAAAEFYNAPPGPTSYEYTDAFSNSYSGPGAGAGGPGMGDGDRGLFTHGFGKPVKPAGSGWSGRLKDFFVGDFYYRPPPPRPPKPLKASHAAYLGPAPGAATHAPTYGTFKPPSLNYGRPTSYNAEYTGPDPLITPFPPPAPPQPPAKPPLVHQQSQSPPPSYQQASFGSSPYQQQQSIHNQYQQQGQSSYQQQGQPASPYQYPAQSGSGSGSPYQQPAQTFSPTMAALAQQGGPSGYFNQSQSPAQTPSPNPQQQQSAPQYHYNSYAPRPPGTGAFNGMPGYNPGRINAGAFKPRPRGEDGDDDGEWDQQQPVEWAQPVYGGTPPAQWQGQAPQHQQWQ